MNWLQRFMMGRYGVDGLSVGIVVLGMILTLTNSFVGWLPLLLLSYVCFGVVLFRMLSRNIEARRKENAAAAKFFRPMLERGKLWMRMWRDRKTHRYFSCPNCKQHVRVPKGKGKIRIVCPRCRKEFTRKS
ncbi:MAG: hypothetical protein PUC47_11460 [Oscillospiraceae bacterium]|nr:hypothetical protein [Oscillospiraceae bacterium]